MAKRGHWSDLAQLELVPIEPGRLFMFRSTVAAKGGYSEEYAYFLVRAAGNCLFHGPGVASFYERQAEFFDTQGGIALQVCSHSGDVSEAAPLIEERWVPRSISIAGTRARSRCL